MEGANIILHQNQGVSAARTICVGYRLFKQLGIMVFAILERQNYPELTRTIQKKKFPHLRK